MSVPNQINFYSGNGNSDIESIAYKQPDPFRTLTSPNLGLSFPSSPLISLEPRKVSFATNTLGQTTHIYSSPLYPDMTSLANYFADWSCAYEIQEGPKHTITVIVPWDTMTNTDFNISLYASENWELIETMDTRPLLVTGIMVNPFAPISTVNNWITLPPILQASVQYALDNKLSIIQFPANAVGSASLAQYIPVAQQVLDYARQGVEGVPSYTQTLKRTAVIDKNNLNHAFQQAADAERSSICASGSINYIMCSADLINAYSIPQDTVAQFMLPSYCKQINVSNLTSPSGSWYSAYAGWLVKPPTLQFIGRNKLQLQQEFIWNEYLQGLYYIYSNQSSFPPIQSYFGD